MVSILGGSKGPLDKSARTRVDSAMREAEIATRLEFSVYVGDLEGDDTRAAARELHGRLRAPSRSVLICASPQQRVLEIVTGERADDRLSDGELDRIGEEMGQCFERGDLVGGLVHGLGSISQSCQRG